MNLVVVGPLPPVRSGIADYNAALLPHLRPLCQSLTAVVDGYSPELPPGLVDQVIEARSVGRSEREAWDSGSVLYHMGSQPQDQRYVFELLQSVPGAALLHDGNLLPFVHGITLGDGDQAAYLREAGLEGGLAGVRAGWQALRGGAALDAACFPMLARVARSSLGVIVHSTSLSERVSDLAPATPVLVAPHLELPRSGPMLSRCQARRALGYREDDLLIGALGTIAPSRCLEAVAQALSALRTEFPRAVLVCVGAVLPGYDFAAVLVQSGAAELIRTTGYVPPEVLEQVVSALDVGIALRWPTWGEMSGALMRLMAAGVPTLVTGAGAFAELPDGVVVRIGPAEPQAANISDALRGLLADCERRREIGQAARAYVERHCSPAAAARSMVAFMQAAAAGGCHALCGNSSEEGAWAA